MTDKHLIGKLTHQADARISSPSGPCYIPGLIEGEEVVLDADQRPTIITPSPNRVTPICADAEGCGGCDLQHMNKQAQAFFKQQVVAQALQRQSLPLVAMKPIRQASKPHRRRARWAINQHGMPCMHQKKSHALVAPTHCHILDETLNLCVACSQITTSRPV
jgi:SAM-dependent methyltransferases related to tRNA (uracil-5-)-methyltransferase